MKFFSPQFVKERRLCHAIIGRQGGKELIMRVDVSADFISPLLEFSTKSVYFRFDKVSTSEYTLERFECFLLILLMSLMKERWCSGIVAIFYCRRFSESFASLYLRIQRTH